MFVQKGQNKRVFREMCVNLSPRRSRLKEISVFGRILSSIFIIIFHRHFISKYKHKCAFNATSGFSRIRKRKENTHIRCSVLHHITYEYIIQ